MNSNLWIHKAFTMCLMVALLATYSMVALAADGKASGEIVVTGTGSNGEAASVSVNGEPVQSGRTIFSSSTITTAENSRAIVNLGKAGKLELAPNTTFVLSFDDAAISGDLASGSVSVLNSLRAVNVKTATGQTVELNAGDTAAADSGTASQTKGGAATGAATGHAWWIFVAIIAGAAAGGAIISATDKNSNTFGSSVTTGVSPTQ
jgi:hypothetical protein